MNGKKKQSPERLEYLRNYRKNHKEQQRIYQKRYVEKLRQQGKFPITTSMKLRKQLEAYENMRKEIKDFLDLYAGMDNNFCLDYHDLNKLYDILNKVGGSDE